MKIENYYYYIANKNERKENQYSNEIAYHFASQFDRCCVVKLTGMLYMASNLKHVTNYINAGVFSYMVC